MIHRQIPVKSYNRYILLRVLEYFDISIRSFFQIVTIGLLWYTFFLSIRFKNKNMTNKFWTLFFIKKNFSCGLQISLSYLFIFNLSICTRYSRWMSWFILVPSDCYSGLLQPSDLRLRSGRRSTAYPIRMSLNIFLIYNIYCLRCLCIDFYDLSACCGRFVFVVFIRRFIYNFF